MKHSYLVSVQQGVFSASAFKSCPLVKVVDGYPFSVLGTVVPGYARHSGALAAIVHLKCYREFILISHCKRRGIQEHSL